MTVEKNQHQALETLKTFNQAITTTRLYPALSPQVANVVEKAYQAIKTYSRSCGELSFANGATGPLVCGLQVPDELRDGVSQLIVFRHLEMLKLENVVLRPNFDRTIFGRILTVFTSRKEKISREGGGRTFVDSLGLEHFFPDDYQPHPGSNETVEEPGATLLVESSTISKGLLGYLFGEHKNDQARSALEEIFLDQLRASEVVVAGIARVLENLNKAEDKDALIVSASYTRFLDTVGTLLHENMHEGVARKTADILLQNTDERMLCILFAQQYLPGFGQIVFGLLSARIENDTFDKVIALLRQWAESFVKQTAELSPQQLIIAKTTDKLLSTSKGKQCIGREKASSLIRTSEKQRQNIRREAGIKALLRGNVESLKSDEVVAILPSTVSQLLRRGRMDEARQIIEKVAAELQHTDDMQRYRLVQSLALIGEKLLIERRWGWLKQISGFLVSWIRDSDDGDVVYEKALLVLQAIMNHSWESQNYSEGDRILTVFHTIRSARLQKSPAVLALVGRIQDRTYNRPYLETFLGQYLQGTGDEKIGERLSMLGQPAGLFLMEAMLQSELASDRQKITALLANMGSIVLPMVLERLPEPMPWYSKRNLIKLATEIAGPGEVKTIAQFLKHDDIRVQQEAFACIYIISGSMRKQALITCLHDSSEIMLSQVVKALLPYSDGQVAEHLGALLLDQEYYSDAIREPLILETLNALARSASHAGIDALQAFMSNRKKKANRRLPDTIWQTAETSMRQIKTAIKSASNADSPLLSEPGAERAASPHINGENPPHDFSAIPKAGQIRELISQGKKDLAKESMLELIAKMARERRFEDAENLRQWLIEIDAMALSEIIRAAEIIEEEKVASLDRDQFEAWSELYDALSSEEFSTFYHALERKFYNNEEVIVRQGTPQTCLYFIVSGKVKVFFSDNGVERFVKTAVQGEILGGNTVINASVWTISAASLMRAEVLSLDIDTLINWRVDEPSLQEKIHDFCMKNQSLETFFATKENDRRAAERHKISGKVNTMLLDNKGKDTGITSNGELFDVSAGGVSFYLRMVQKKDARLLLGRDIKVMIPLAGSTPKYVGARGTIIAIRGHQTLENNYSVHVQFKRNLTPEDVQVIVRTNHGTIS